MNNNINNNMNNNLNNNINNNQIPDLNNNVVENNEIEDKEFEAKRKKRILIMSILGSFIITVSIIVIAMSGSYAYFVNEVEHVEGNRENEKVTFSSGKLKMKMVFESGSDYISCTNAKLLDLVEDTNDNDSSTTATITESDLPKNERDFTTFTISFDEGNDVAKAKYSLYLTDVQASANFFNHYVKWVLFEVHDGGSDTQVAYGHFGDTTKVIKANGETSVTGKEKVNVNNITLLDNVEISSTPNESKKYKLYFWLENDKTKNQANNCESYDNCIDLREGSLSAKIAFRAVSYVNTSTP